MVSTPTRYVCIKCREISLTDQCLRCGGEATLVHSKWRPPKKHNDKAWKLIEKGEWLWDVRHIDRSKRHRSRKKISSLKKYLERLLEKKDIDNDTLRGTIKNIQRRLEQYNSSG